MNREQKAKVVAERQEVFSGAESIIVTVNNGLTVAAVTALRSKSHAEGVSYKVAKNRLVKRALQGTRFEGIGSMLKGPVGLMTSKDPVAAAKVAANFAKDNDNLVIIGGALGDKVLDKAGIEALAKLPSLDQIRGMLVGLIQTPAQRIATISKEPASQLARVVQAYADKG